MLVQNFLTFQTKIGTCGIRWHESAITGLLLPEDSLVILNKKLKSDSVGRLCKNPPPWIKEVIKKVKLHLDGKLQDFSSVPTDTTHASDFTNSVYEAAKNIPPGKIISYQGLCKKVRKPKASRALGSALGKNPILLIIPCHRIITSNGKLGGFSAAGGINTKMKLLEIEGVSLKKPLTIGSSATWKKATTDLLKKIKTFLRFLKIKSQLYLNLN